MITLEEKPNDEVFYYNICLTLKLGFIVVDQILANLFDYAIEEIENHRAVNEQQVDELQRTNTQLNKALEVSLVKNIIVQY